MSKKELPEKLYANAYLDMPGEWIFSALELGHPELREEYVRSDPLPPPASVKGAEELKAKDAEIERLKSEVEEQCRLNGMGAQRELKLETQLEAYRKAVGEVREGMQRAADRCSHDFDGSGELCDCSTEMRRETVEALALLDQLGKGEANGKVS